MKTNRRKFCKTLGIATASLASGFHTNLWSMGQNSVHNYEVSGRSFAFDFTQRPTDIHIARPIDHGEALRNPKMGWVTYFYSNLYQNYGSRLAPSDSVRYFPGMNTVFLRLPWSFIEPKEDHYMWEVLDTPAQRWIDDGGEVALCITATENWMESGTPKWVFDKGAEFYRVDGYIEPDYDDPIFLEEVEKFVQILAERYDNNPHISYVFIGHYGMWGEGHTVLTTPKHGHSWGFETQKRIIDIYRRHFKNTTLCISDDYAGHDVRGKRFPITDYSFSQGVTIHDDSILVQPKPNHWYHSEMAQLFWPTLPVVLEHEHFGGSVEKGAWDDELLLQAIEEYHASFLSIHWWPDLFFNQKKDIINRINQRIGYRLRASEIIWPAVINKGEPFIIQSKWSNAGVAPCYGGGYPCFTLKDEKGGIVSVLTDNSFNIRELPVTSPAKKVEQSLSSTFVIAPAHHDNKGNFYRTCLPGRYDLYISVGEKDGTPVYELPYPDSDGKKRYKVGSIVLNDYGSS